MEENVQLSSYLINYLNANASRRTMAHISCCWLLFTLRVSTIIGGSDERAWDRI